MANFVVPAKFAVLLIEGLIPILEWGMRKELHIQRLSAEVVLWINTNLLVVEHKRVKQKNDYCYYNLQIKLLHQYQTQQKYNVEILMWI